MKLFPGSLALDLWPSILARNPSRPSFFPTAIAAPRGRFAAKNVDVRVLHFVAAHPITQSVMGLQEGGSGCGGWPIPVPHRREMVPTRDTLGD